MQGGQAPIDQTVPLLLPFMHMPQEKSNLSLAFPGSIDGSLNLWKVEERAMCVTNSWYHSTAIVSTSLQGVNPG